MQSLEGALEHAFAGGQVLLIRVSIHVCELGFHLVIHLQPLQLGGKALPGGEQALTHLPRGGYVDEAPLEGWVDEIMLEPEGPPPPES